ncbi:MAG: Hsp20/alpha crystallin family protein [Synoicihabitans sp.]
MNLINSLIPSFSRAPVVSHGHRDEDLGPTIQPTYEIKETDDAFGLTVTLPGVTKKDLEITAEADSIRIVGKRSWSRPKDWAVLYRETSDATYVLELDHDNAVNTDKVHAELRDGILRLSLPKAEAIKPRRIEVA